MEKQDPQERLRLLDSALSNCCDLIKVIMYIKGYTDINQMIGDVKYSVLIRLQSELFSRIKAISLDAEKH